ncbi:hypothetical protein [Halopseudomonas salegens]|uniref:Elongation factor Tu n=1 Tax=Halopseudomonas salegens TaxID=1434072 RepID=A0A1H2G2Z9_9GAMM|nr:hypothetical protein [Halopseudomonas salegens]SDU14006.1 elongation factor Tu [Halopseudomonas salegens]
MHWVTVDVEALLTMLPGEESGWTNPVTSGLRPNHNFLGPGNSEMCMGQIMVAQGAGIAPGEQGIVRIRFVVLPEYAAMLKPGFRWRLQAASQHFANAEVLAIHGA